MGIAVVVTAHPARIANGMLQRALLSVAAQTKQPDELIIEVDYARAGSAHTRNLALRRVRQTWVAFLDSDDMLYPDHLNALDSTRLLTGADLVYPWFAHPGRDDPYPGRFEKPFDPDLLRVRNYIPITILARTSLIRQVGGFRADLTIAPPAQCDDWGTWLRILDRDIIDGYGARKRGAHIVHCPERTWEWSVHGGNTSGSPLLGDAKRWKG